MLIWKKIVRVVYKFMWYSKFNISEKICFIKPNPLVKHQYRYSNINELTQLIVEVQQVSDITYLDHFYVLYRWAEAKLNKENRNFHLKAWESTKAIFRYNFNIV